MFFIDTHIIFFNLKLDLFYYFADVYIPDAFDVATKKVASIPGYLRDRGFSWDFQITHGDDGNFAAAPNQFLAGLRNIGFDLDGIKVPSSFPGHQVGGGNADEAFRIEGGGSYAAPSSSSAAPVTYNADGSMNAPAGFDQTQLYHEQQFVCWDEKRNIYVTVPCHFVYFDEQQQQFVIDPISSNTATPMLPVHGLNMAGRVGAYTPEERALMIARFRAKKMRRVWKKHVKFDARKSKQISVDSPRARVKGRFVNGMGEDVEEYDDDDDDEDEVEIEDEDDEEGN